MIDIATLVEEHQKIKSYLEGESKRFSEFCKPYNERIEQIQAAVSAAMTEQGIKSLKTDHGTPILSEITSAKIIPDERDAYIDMCLENWDAFGGEMLVIGAPKADAVRSYMDAHEGQLPPHIVIDKFFRFSIRKA